GYVNLFPRYSFITFDAKDDMILGDTRNGRLREISAASGIVSTIAGNGTLGFAGDGGPAVDAEFNEVTSIALAPNGDLYLADPSNFRVRRISQGIITTVAGTGTYGTAGDGGPAVDAQLSGPLAVAVDPRGNVYIGDSGFHTVAAPGYCRLRRISN